VLRRYAIAVVLLAGLAAAPSARADTQVATSGQVKATFTFTQGDYGQTSDQHLTIDRAGQRLYDQPLDVCCQPMGTKAVHARDLDGDGEPEVWVDIYAGGAHCCDQMELFRLAGGAYQHQEQVFELGYHLKDLDGDGVPEFRTIDYGFTYVFTFFARSPLPVRVMRFKAGTFSIVTREFPALVRKDRDYYRRAYFKGIRRHTPSLGALAGWTADEYLLGHVKKADRRLTHELHAKHLYNDPGYPHGRRFIRVLKRDLRAGGYAA
jgi:hypothetical protein